jgi:uncharacterized membrane protein YfcA
MTVTMGLLLFLGGIAAGFINTLAGGGSALTVPLLTEMLGGNAILANGTNRIAILLQNIVGVRSFHKAGKLPWKMVKPVILPIVLGAIGGALLATAIDPPAMKRALGIVVLLVALTALIKPSRWLGGQEKVMPEPWRFLAFFGIGLFGGFIQVGVGFLLLAGLVLGSGLDLVRGNAAKVLLVLVYTPAVLLIFWQDQQVDLVAGLVLACGNMTGAYVAARLAVKKGAAWVRWVLIGAAVLAAVRMLLF